MKNVLQLQKKTLQEKNGVAHLQMKMEITLLELMNGDIVLKYRLQKRKIY